MQLLPAIAGGALARYVGYYKPYATSHDELDQDQAFMTEVKNSAAILVETVRRIRAGTYTRVYTGVDEPRPK
jgi:hypothetical protein